MVPAKVGIVVGEEKAVTSDRLRSGEAGCGEPGSTDLEARETELWGSGEAKRPALLIALLSTVHAGGEQGWKSGHLEPFSFWGRILSGLLPMSTGFCHHVPRLYGRRNCP